MLGDWDFGPLCRCWGLWCVGSVLWAWGSGWGVWGAVGRCRLLLRVFWLLLPGLALCVGGRLGVAAGLCVGRIWCSPDISLIPRILSFFFSCVGTKA